MRSRKTGWLVGVCGRLLSPAKVRRGEQTNLDGGASEDRCANWLVYGRAGELPSSHRRCAVAVIKPLRAETTIRNPSFPLSRQKTAANQHPCEERNRTEGVCRECAKECHAG